MIDEIHQSLKEKGMNWPIEKMDEFFADKSKLWKNEILALNHLVGLEEGDDRMEITKEILAYPGE